MSARAAWTLAACLALGCSSAPEPALPPLREEPPPEPSAADPAAGMRTWYLAMLYRGPAWTPDATPATIELQERHLANIDRLAATGKLVLAGPFYPPVGDDPPVGLFLFDVPTLEEAEALAASDPAVRAGRLRAVVLTWYGPVGISSAGAGR